MTCPISRTEEEGDESTLAQLLAAFVFCYGLCVLGSAVLYWMISRTHDDLRDPRKKKREDRSEYSTKHSGKCADVCVLALIIFLSSLFGSLLVVLIKSLCRA